MDGTCDIRKGSKTSEVIRMGKKDKEFQIKWKTDLPYRYSIGKLAVKFLEELKKKGGI